jgi:hypothetical protein
MASQVENLVKMANQIALNVGPDAELDTVARKTGNHIRLFWTPAMRGSLGEYARAGGESLLPAVMRMVELDESDFLPPGSEKKWE